MITKTRQPTSQNYTCTFSRKSSSTSGPNFSWSATYPVAIPGETITYDEGPRIIHQPYAHPNWKRCMHQQASPAHAAFSCSNASTVSFFPGVTDSSEMRTAGLNVFDGSWVFPSIPAMPTLDLKDLAERMYADMAGRVDSYFLSLEDLAGFFSGNSLFKAIRYAGSTTSIFAKSVRDLRRLQRAFGSRASLYNMWLSSKELVRAICGLDLASRFSFKATLDDICQLASLITDASTRLASLRLRNDREVMRYTKTAQAADTNETVVSGSAIKDRITEIFRKRFDYSPNPPQSAPANMFHDGRLIARSEARANVFSWARVHYPKQYLTMGRMLQDGLGLSKPLTTLWAIVPCSFLIDYILRVEERLTRLDNMLNEVGVYVDIKDSWVVETKNSFLQIDLPPADSIEDAGWYRVENHFSGCTARRYIRKDFQRYPISVAEIMSTVTPLLRVQQDNWLRRIGTGLEILLQRH